MIDVSQVTVEPVSDNGYRFRDKLDAYFAEGDEGTEALRMSFKEALGSVLSRRQLHMGLEKRQSLAALAKANGEGLDWIRETFRSIGGMLVVQKDLEIGDAESLPNYLTVFGSVSGPEDGSSLKRFPKGFCAIGDVNLANSIILETLLIPKEGSDTAYTFIGKSMDLRGCQNLVNVISGLFYVGDTIKVVQTYETRRFVESARRRMYTDFSIGDVELYDGQGRLIEEERLPAEEPTN